MKAEKLLKSITLDPNVMTGKPVIRGTRLTVQFILGLLAQGATVEEILSEYNGLTREDIQACTESHGFYSVSSVNSVVFVEGYKQENDNPQTNRT